MSREQFDLVPETVKQRIALARRSRRANAASMAIASMTVAVLAGSMWLDGHSRQTLEKARETAGPALALVGETERLAREAQALATKIDLQRAVGVQIPASGLVQAIGHSLPAGATLEKISLDFMHVQGTERKARRGAKAEVPPRELHGEIAGIASSEADVGMLVDRLEGIAPLKAVSLESSRSREFRGRAAREFRVSFKVDLDRRWEMPAIAGAQGAEP